MKLVVWGAACWERNETSITNEVLHGAGGEGILLASKNILNNTQDTTATE
jgi:hypothetical protein